VKQQPKNAVGYEPHHGSRPTSPHIFIYKQPLPAISSITHRATGVILAVGVIGYGVMGLVSPWGLLATVGTFKYMSSFLPVILAKSTISFSLIYHTLAGYRHIWWDARPNEVELPKAFQTTRIIMGTTAVLTLLLTFINF